ncbi:hypothetical protein M3J09_012393 [Ascochyta lentis]
MLDDSGTGKLRVGLATDKLGGVKGIFERLVTIDRMTTDKAATEVFGHVTAAAVQILVGLAGVRATRNSESLQLAPRS